MPKEFDKEKPSRLNATGVPTTYTKRVGSWIIGAVFLLLMVVAYLNS